MGEPGRVRVPGRPAPPDLPSAPSRRPNRRSGVAVVAGGLLQDLEERLRRDLAPVEERVRPGEELRGLSGGPGSEPGHPGDPIVIVLAAGSAGPEVDSPDGTA